MEEIDLIINHLRKCFEVKTFGAKCFLGIEIDRVNDGSIRIHQGAYARKVLQRFNMMECRITSASMDCNQNLGDFADDECDEVYPWGMSLDSLIFH